eukprot:SAG31_NODE_833_length_11657_cov_3.652535_2_plen_218_part_00
MNITVAVRVRPPLQREFLGESGCDRQGFVPCVQLGADGATVRLQQPSASDRSRPRGEGGTASYHEYTFDYVHGTSASQADVYDVSAKAAVESVLQGYNATIIAYGQTGSGKTHTMEGPPSSLASTNENLDRVQQDSGLIPRAISDVFGHIQEATAALGAVEQAGRSLKFLVRARCVLSSRLLYCTEPKVIYYATCESVICRCTTRSYLIFSSQNGQA